MFNGGEPLTIKHDLFGLNKNLQSEQLFADVIGYNWIRYMYVNSVKLKKNVTFHCTETLS